MGTAARAAQEHFFSALATEDRGSARNANDRTFESQARHFGKWSELEDIWDTQFIQVFQDDPCQLIPILGFYLLQVADGKGIRGTQGLAPKTITGHLHAAVAWIKVELDIEVPIYQPLQYKGIHPAFKEILRQRRSWYQPNHKKEPFTHEMLAHLHKQTRSTAFHSKSLHMDTAIFDWMCLGSFTGSRLSKYGQSKQKIGESYATVPCTIAAGKWGTSYCIYT